MSFSTSCLPQTLYGETSALKERIPNILILLVKNYYFSNSILRKYEAKYNKNKTISKAIDLLAEIYVPPFKNVFF